MSKFRRRDFLLRCGRTAGAFLLPTVVRRANSARAGSLAPEFHLEPHYREQTPLDAELIQIKPGLDGFPTEVYHDKIAAILKTWSRSLIESPKNTQAIERVLGQKFRGTAWQPIEFHPLRPDSKVLDVRRARIDPRTSVTAEVFVNQLRAAMSEFSQILTAEFQITKIDAAVYGLDTRVRYEVVGSGHGFYREQRSGYWSLGWEADSQNGHRVVSWQAEEEVRSRSSKPLFGDVTGRAFRETASYPAQMLHGADYWRTTLDGACGIDIYGHNGIAVGDIEGRGCDDIYVCQPAGLPNRLYRNQGDGTFEDITEESGTGVLENTACALFADLDNDGRQDLVVVRANGPLFFWNEGNGKFRLKPNAFTFARAPQGTFTGAAVADYNRDGLLDIYFCLYTYYQGADQYRYPTPYFAAENGPPNFLMQNNGDGTFRDVTVQCGLDKNNTRFSFCCGWGDYNGDGWPDLYVVNDFGKKNLYRNNGDGTFSDVAPEAGVEDLGAGMSVCWFDYDNDGAEDLYVGNMWTAAGERITSQDAFQKEAALQIRAGYRKHAMGNTLFGKNTDGAFRDVTREAQTAMGRWAWSSDAWDFDHDGFSDIYVVNGMISGTGREDLNGFFWRQVVAKSPNTAKAAADYEQGWNAINELIRAGHSWSGYERNVVYANNRDGTFSDVSGALGLDFSEDGRAFALADFDGDGRQEILLKNRNAPQLRLMKNTIPDLPPAIALRLRGTKSNRDAIGAAVTVETSAGRQTRLLQAGSGFLSQHSKELFFGLGEATVLVSATVRWPSGLTQELQELRPNHRVWVTEGSESVRVEAFKTYQQEGGSAGGPALGESFPESVETWLLSPVPAPDFSLAGANGKSWTLSALQGKRVLLVFRAAESPGSSDVLQELERVHGDWMRDGLQPMILDVGGGQLRKTPQTSFPTLRASDDVAAVYSLLFRYLFDRHRDLPLPTSFLVNEKGQIVKVCQGRIDFRNMGGDSRDIPASDAERLARGLPFRGVTETFEFGRNYLSLGSTFFQRGYVEYAEGFFQTALKDDPSSAEALYGVGSVYLKQEKNSQAKECFERALKAKASYPDTMPNAWNNLGILATRERDTAKAAEYFERALQLEPDHFVALENLGNAYRLQQRPEEARQALERALAIKPADPQANYSLAMVFAQLNDTTQAYEYLRKALQARPDYPEALNNLGVLYLRTRRRDEAVEAFERCMRAAPEFDQSYLNLAKVYEIEGDAGKARAILVALLKQRPDDATAQRALAQLP